MSRELIEQGIEVLFRGGRKSFGPAGDQFLKTLSKKDKFNLKNLHKVNPEGFEGFGESVRRTYDGPQDQGAVDAGWGIIGTLDDLELKGKDAWEQQLNLDSKNIPDNIEPEANVTKIDSEVQPQESLVSVSEDLNYLKEGVDYTDELAQLDKNDAIAVAGMEKALGKPDPKFSEDLLNRRTTIAQIPGQVKKWLKKAEQKWKAGIPFEEGDALTDELGEFLGSSIKDMTFQELHHELMKAVYSAYVDTAMKLAKSGSGNKMDVLNLNHMADSYGFGMGDFGVEPYPRISHSWAHNELIKEGVQKSGQALKDQVQAITELPDMQSLTQSFKQSLEELAVPMRRKMDLGQRAYMKLPQTDRLKVHQLKSAKDNLKDTLKEVMIGEFQQAGLPIPSSGGGVQFLQAFKKAGGKPSQEALELDKAIKLTRKEGKALNKSMKEAIGPIVEKDVNLDVKEMEQLIDQQFEGITEADTMTREFDLKRGSMREASAKAEQKAAAEAYSEPAVEPKTMEEARANMEAIKAGTLHYPGQKRGAN